MWTKENVDEFRDFAGAKYRANMRLDNLPGAELVVFRDQNGQVAILLAFPFILHSLPGARLVLAALGPTVG